MKQIIFALFFMSCSVAWADSGCCIHINPFTTASEYRIPRPIEYKQGTGHIVNNDNHISISYYKEGTDVPVTIEDSDGTEYMKFRVDVIVITRNGTPEVYPMKAVEPHGGMEFLQDGRIIIGGTIIAKCKCKGGCSITGLGTVFHTDPIDFRGLSEH